MYATLETSYWSDADFKSAEAKHLYLYLFTGPEAHGITGVYRLPTEATIVSHTLLTPAQIAKAMNELIANKKIVVTKSGWIWVVGRVRYGIISPTTATAAIRYLIRSPGLLAAMVAARYRIHLLRNGVKEQQIKDLIALADTVYDTVSGTVSSELNCNTGKEREGHVSSVGGGVGGDSGVETELSQLPISPENSEHKNPTENLTDNPPFAPDSAGAAGPTKESAAALATSPAGSDGSFRRLNKFVLPFREWIAKNYNNIRLEPWFDETVNLAFASGVTPRDAKEAVTKSPGLLLDSKALTKAMIARYQDRRATPAMAKFNPDGTVDESQWK